MFKYLQRRRLNAARCTTDAAKLVKQQQFDLNLFLISFYPDGRVTAGTSPRSGKPQSSTIEGINCRALRRIRWEILSLRLNKILCPNLQSQNDDLIPLIVDDGACGFTVAVGAQKSCDKSFDKP
ncbi:hypothetical protein HN011_011070 [Eciton burchellii]|nr:hypothetical protein HN011_011070 [Eciton burchellii]